MNEKFGLTWELEIYGLTQVELDIDGLFRVVDGLTRVELEIGANAASAYHSRTLGSFQAAFCCRCMFVLFGLKTPSNRAF